MSHDARQRIFHRHHALHRLQGLRGGLQAVESVAGRWFHSPACPTTTPCTWAHPRGGMWRSSNGRWRLHEPGCGRVFLAVFLRCLQALRARRMPGELSHRRDYSHRIRFRVRAARHLQRMRLLRGQLPVRRDRPSRGRRPRLEMHALLRPLAGGHEAGLRQGVSDRIDPVRRCRELRSKAQARVEKLHRNGLAEAYLYGADKASQPGTEGLNAFFLLVDKPEVYNLPPDPVVPTKPAKKAWASMGLAALGMAAIAVASVLAQGKESRS